MTTTEATARSGPRPVRFARRSTRGWLYGMSKPRLAVVAAAIAVFVVALLIAGPQGVLATSPGWASALAVAYVPVHGRKVVDWLPVVGHWWWRKLTGQHRFRARPLKPRPAGTLAARAGGWGRVLGGLASHDRGITRVQVLERALPDAGVDVAAWWAAHGHHDGTWMATAYDELLASAAPTSERHETLVAITLNLKAAAGPVREQGGGLRGAAAVMRQRMMSFEAATRAAELAPAG